MIWEVWTVNKKIRRGPAGAAALFDVTARARGRGAKPAMGPQLALHTRIMVHVYIYQLLQHVGICQLLQLE